MFPSRCTLRVLCLFIALSRAVGALQIYIINIIIWTNSARTTSLFRPFSLDCGWSETKTAFSAALCKMVMERSICRNGKWIYTSVLNCRLDYIRLCHYICAAYSFTLIFGYNSSCESLQTRVCFWYACLSIVVSVWSLLRKKKNSRETGKTPTVITGFSVIGIITPTFELVRTRMAYSVCS